jgi:hypothetical protein
MIIIVIIIVIEYFFFIGATTLGLGLNHGSVTVNLSCLGP